MYLNVLFFFFHVCCQYVCLFQHSLVKGLSAHVQVQRFSPCLKGVSSDEKVRVSWTYPPIFDSNSQQVIDVMSRNYKNCCRLFFSLPWFLLLDLYLSPFLFGNIPLDFFWRDGWLPACENRAFGCSRKTVTNPRWWSSIFGFDRFLAQGVCRRSSEEGQFSTEDHPK